MMLRRRTLLAAGTALLGSLPVSEFPQRPLGGFRSALVLTISDHEALEVECSDPQADHERFLYI